MPDRPSDGKMPYTEAQVTHWLSWLARGMQQHAQTIFLIENLQPSWLLTRRERRRYVFRAGMLDGLLFGLILAIVAGLAVGLAASAPSEILGAGLDDGLQAFIMAGMAGLFCGIFKGFLDWSWLEQKRLRLHVKKLGSRWHRLFYAVLTGILIVVAYAASLLVFMLVERFYHVPDFFAASNYQYFVEWWPEPLLIAGMIVGAAAVLLWSRRSDHLSLTDDVRTVESLGWSWDSAWQAALSMLRLVLLAIAILAAAYLAINWNQHPQHAWKEDLLDTVAPWASLGFAFSLIWTLIWEAIRNVRRGEHPDGLEAQPRWSWQRVVRRSLAVITVIVYVILIACLPAIDEAIPFTGFVSGTFATSEAESLSLILFAGLVLALVRGVFAGLRKGVVEMKVRPNEGIRLSLRNALLGGGCLGGVLGAGAFLLAIAYLVFGEFLSDVDEGLLVAVAFAVFVAIISGLFAGLWYGGRDALRHVVLRSILHRSNYTPRRLAHFLDFAADELNFLQKVGGGYIFIHRYLLEHFAGMADDVGSAPLQASQ